MLGHVGLPRYYGNYGEALAPARRVWWVRLQARACVFVVSTERLSTCVTTLTPITLWSHGAGGGGGSKGG